MQYSSHGKSAAAVDGKKIPEYFAWSCTHTSYNIHAWWAVDLGMITDIKRVGILNRRDCCGEENY